MMEVYDERERKQEESGTTWHVAGNSGWKITQEHNVPLTREVGRKQVPSVW